MTVTRRVTITYDAPDEDRAEWVAEYLVRLIMGLDTGVMDLRRFHGVTLSGQAFTVEPVIPSPEPLVDDGPSGLGVPEGWHVTWCPGCCYSVTYTPAELADFDAYEHNVLWHEIVSEAFQHDCPARVPA